MIEVLWRGVLPTALAAITTWLFVHFEWWGPGWLVFVIAEVVFLLVINFPELIGEVLDGL